MLTLSKANRYLKNSVGKFFSKQQLQKRLRIIVFFKTAAAKEVANNSFFQKDTNHIHRVSHNGVNVQKVI